MAPFTCNKRSRCEIQRKYCDADLIETERRRVFEAALSRYGYYGFRWFGDVCVGLYDYITTRGIVVDLNMVSYERRYCYQDREEASQALLEWDGVGHPGGNWIKLKGRWQGQIVDLLNPNWSQS